ncbi:uncharacterized protein LOC133820560 [Humulus lupulus]|uniref:uncharacterized protein LOC133820560 n=1 Tax=Humulus lupulus TaxID=3486 RepID=UPI002B4090C3|nr:uncharacterized protein LOC133820560 [Humulus lupulus]
MKNDEIAALLQALDLKWEQRAESQLENFKLMLEQHTAKTEEKFTHLSQSSSPATGREGSTERGGGGRSESESDVRDVNTILKTMRVKIPRFDGTAVDDWIYKINKLFDLHRVAPELRLARVPFHLDGAASAWFQWMEKGGSFTDWDAFLRALQLRFGTSIYDDPLGCISKLTQTGRVADYRAEFESLMPRITGVQDSMFLNFFIWGLKLEIRRELLMAKPIDLADAMAKAQLFKDRHDDLTGKLRSAYTCSSWTPQTGFIPRESGVVAASTMNTNPIPPGGVSSKTSGPSTPQLPIKRLSPAEIKNRRDRGLCFTCDEKFNFGHKCKNRMLILYGQEDDDCETDLEAELQDMEDVTEEEVSLNSLSNSLNPRIFRIMAHHGSETLEVLIDTGSNNNFIQEALVAKLRLQCEDTKRFRVYMGNGNFLMCSKVCKGAELSLQGHCFAVDLFVLPICGLDVVLGMQWLQTLGPCIHDHKALTMEFSWQGKTVKLAGLTDTYPQRLSYTQFHALLRDGEVQDVYKVAPLPNPVLDNTEELEALETHFPTQGKGLLRDFAAVFAAPKQLPPYRGVDHRIFLQPGSKPVNVRPYRYPYFQKDIIEKLVQEMSELGFIRSSTSPYSSPVLLVKKKDGSWRFCIDYRALNEITVKDRFPIPTIDELLDELGAAVIFSKLDLRAGYHQIRMNRSDIHKTAFRTHEGHYEFIVMPFGLTNAPSTFQAAMNQLFRPHLRHFVIVFFYDILIYSNSVQEHVDHLRVVLSLLQEHQFFVKGSKCKFFQTTIDYLGHLVSAQGVCADPAKISAMVDWPIPKTIKQLRGFLGLTGYYRRFVAHYATIAAPLTEMLKKDCFMWTPAAATAFATLKTEMTNTPVLRLPDFSKEFVIETDASSVGIGGVLMQEGHPVAFFSKKLGPHFAGASAYSREMRAIIEVVTKWRQYLLGRHFTIRTDHKSLKELLTQVIQTPEQQQFLCKLLGFHFSIEYKPGRTNAAADALSRQQAETPPAMFMAVSKGCFDFLDVLRQENITCPDLRRLHEQ